MNLCENQLQLIESYAKFVYGLINEQKELI